MIYESETLPAERGLYWMSDRSGVGWLVVRTESGECRLRSLAGVGHSVVSLPEGARWTGPLRSDDP